MIPKCLMGSTTLDATEGLSAAYTSKGVKGKCDLLGLDYRHYVKFRLLTPHITRVLSGDYHISRGTRDEPPSLDECRFCYDFVVGSAIRLQDFDFAVDGNVGQTMEYGAQHGLCGSLRSPKCFAPSQSPKKLLANPAPTQCGLSVSTTCLVTKDPGPPNQRQPAFGAEAMALCPNLNPEI